MDKVFTGNGYRKCKKDKCEFVKKEAEKLAICGITVDDGFFASTRDEKWIAQQVEMLWKAFKEIMVKRRDEIGIVGMNVRMDRKKQGSNPIAT
jgi:hypothetical protein